MPINGYHSPNQKNCVASSFPLDSEYEDKIPINGVLANFFGLENSG